jgi:hypothetical protein
VNLWLLTLLREAFSAGIGYFANMSAAPQLTKTARHFEALLGGGDAGGTNTTCGFRQGNLAYIQREGERHVVLVTRIRGVRCFCYGAPVAGCCCGLDSVNRVANRLASDVLAFAELLEEGEEEGEARVVFNAVDEDLLVLPFTQPGPIQTARHNRAHHQPDHPAV